MLKRLTLMIATGLGLGYSPFAPGTCGTLLGVGIAVAVAPLALSWQIVAAAVLALLAIPVCQVAEDHFGRKDDRRIVADEFLTFPLCVLGLPWADHLWLLGLAFVTHRILDILKPPPANWSQGLGGGLGIAADDIIAALYALGLNHLVWWGVRAIWG